MNLLRTTYYKSSVLIGIFLVFAVSVFSQKPVDRGENCEPEIPTSQLLRSINFNGYVSIGSMTVYCFPKPKDRITTYDYDPYKGPKLKTNVKTSNGTLLNTYVWYARQTLSARGLIFMRYEVVGGYEALKELSAGDYFLEFAIDEKVFQKFPFSVQTKKSNDPYNPSETIYLIDGAWRDTGILEASIEGKMLCFNFWMRAGYDIASTQQESVPYKMELIRDKDKKVMAVNSTTKTLYLGSTWKPYRQCFRNPEIPVNQRDDTLFFKEIMAVNSGYTINLSVNGKPYAVYKFTVKDGKVNDKDLPKRTAVLRLPAKVLNK